MFVREIKGIFVIYKWKNFEHKCKFEEWKFETRFWTIKQLSENL